ncbi:MAG: LCP family protein [Actinomycetes bacterium]
MADEPTIHHSPWRTVLSLLAAMVVAALLILGGRALLMRGSEPTPTPSPQPTATAATATATSSSSPSPTPVGPNQQSLLIQIRDDDGLAQANALMSSTLDPQKGSFVTIAPRLLVDVPGGPQTLLEATSASTNAFASQELLSNMVGVKIDATWALDRLALAGLVDSIGGIYLDVRTPVVFRADDGTVLVQLRPGIQQLDGTTAAAYVLTRQRGEPEAARMARFTEVMRQVLLRLPADASHVELLLGSLGSLSRVTIPIDAMSDLLLRLRSAVDTNRVERQEMPVNSVTLGPALAERLDFVAAETLMSAEFDELQLVPSKEVPIRALVVNGTSRVGMGPTARAPLEAAGMVYLTGGTFPKVGLAISTVTYREGVAGAASWAYDVAKALRLPLTAMRSSSGPPNTADVTVVLGADYRPAAAPSPEPTLSPEPTPKA